MSLAAVFVALAVGLLLGVTIGDTELLSNVRGDLERSLSADLDEARGRNAEYKRRIDDQNEFLRSVYPQLVSRRLAGAHIALIGSAGSSRGITRPFAGAIEPAGAAIAYVAELVGKPRYVDLAREIGADVSMRGDAGVDAFTVKQAERLGVAVGHRIARGQNRLQLRRLAFRKLSGNMRKVRLFVFARREPTAIKTPDGRRLDAFERGVVKGLAADAARVVGVETSGTHPSNVKWYASLGLSSVDHLEQFSGHYALVLVLTGAKGDYGYKDTADAVIPTVAP